MIWDDELSTEKDDSGAGLAPFETLGQHGGRAATRAFASLWPGHASTTMSKNKRGS